MTQNQENTPNLPIKPPLSKRLMRRLEETLGDHFASLPIDVMVEHMAILDIAFRNGIHHALTGSTDAHIFHAALKAQNQYRHTFNALNHFDNTMRHHPKT